MQFRWEKNMNKLIGLGALILILSACAGAPQRIYTSEVRRTEGYRLSALVAQPNPTAPNIFVVGDKIVIDQEPIRPPGNQAGDPVVMYFALEEGGVYSFPEHGIEIKGHTDFCSPTGSVYIFKCAYSRPAPDTIYKYVVRLKKAGGGRVTDLDPTIMN
jgi:hypothetical protein